MSKRYEVEGTKEYLYWAIGLTILCLWCIRDGWFPPASKLDKYPMPTDTTLNFWGWPLDPKSTWDFQAFYAFNRIMAFISGIGAVVAALIHQRVK